MAGGAPPVGEPPVAASRGSAVRLAIALRIAAASATVRACGPTVSCVLEFWTTLARLVRPTVSLIPTVPFAFAGQTIEPSVSVPRPAAQRLPDTEAAEPELEPHGLRSRTYGLFVCRPWPDHPLEEWKERKLAHSLRFVLARMIAPASRSFFATVASWAAGAPA